MRRPSQSGPSRSAPGEIPRLQSGLIVSAQSIDRPPTNRGAPTSARRAPSATGHLSARPTSASRGGGRPSSANPSAAQSTATATSASLYHPLGRPISQTANSSLEFRPLTATRRQDVVGQQQQQQQQPAAKTMWETTPPTTGSTTLKHPSHSIQIQELDMQRLADVVSQLTSARAHSPSHNGNSEQSPPLFRKIALGGATDPKIPELNLQSNGNNNSTNDLFSKPLPSPLSTTSTTTTNPKKEVNVVTIHVRDEANGTTRDFKCDRDVLCREMKYFREYLTPSARVEDLDISVHCDVAIFQWLMDYVNNPDKPPQLDIYSVVSILISSEFLQMDRLVSHCVSFLHKKAADVVRLPVDFSCLSDTLMNTLSDMFSLDQLDEVRDRKEKFVGRIYKRKLDHLLLQPESLLHMCALCGTMYSPAHSEWLRCPRAKVSIDFHGHATADHIPDRTWEISKYLSVLHSEKKMMWSELFWRIWGMLHAFSCTRCCKKFVACELGHCSYHPAEPQFDPPNANIGKYPCCGGTAVRFDSGTGSNVSRKGCCARNHLATPFGPTGTPQDLDVLMKRDYLISIPFDTTSTLPTDLAARTPDRHSTESSLIRQSQPSPATLFSTDGSGGSGGGAPKRRYGHRDMSSPEKISSSGGHSSGSYSTSDSDSSQHSSSNSESEDNNSNNTKKRISQSTTNQQQVQPLALNGSAGAAAKGGGSGKQQLGEGSSGGGGVAKSGGGGFVERIRGPTSVGGSLTALPKTPKPPLGATSSSSTNPLPSQRGPPPSARTTTTTTTTSNRNSTTTTTTTTLSRPASAPTARRSVSSAPRIGSAGKSGKSTAAAAAAAESDAEGGGISLDYFSPDSVDSDGGFQSSSGSDHSDLEREYRASPRKSRFRAPVPAKPGTSPPPVVEPARSSTRLSSFKKKRKCALASGTTQKEKGAAFRNILREEEMSRLDDVIMLLQSMRKEPRPQIKEQNKKPKPVAPKPRAPSATRGFLRIPKR